MTASDSGVSPRLYRRSQEHGNEWQPSNTWRFTFLDRMSLPPRVGTMFEGHSFIAQCMGSIIGTMVAGEMNDWQPSPCCVRRLVSPSGRLHNEDGLSSGSGFSTFGKDETAKLPDNTTTEHWDVRTCGWYQDGERHSFTSKFQMAVTVWFSKAQRRTVWRVLNELMWPGGDGWILMDTPPASVLWETATTGCVEKPVKKPEDRTILPQEQLSSSAQASFEFTCTSVEEAMFCDCSVDLATASKMPEGPRRNAVTKPATCAGKRQHGRRRMSSGHTSPRRQFVRFAGRGLQL